MDLVYAVQEVLSRYKQTFINFEKDNKAEITIIILEKTLAIFNFAHVNLNQTLKLNSSIKSSNNSLKLGQIKPLFNTDYKQVSKSFTVNK